MSRHIRVDAVFRGGHTAGLAVGGAVIAAAAMSILASRPLQTDAAFVLSVVILVAAATYGALAISNPSDDAVTRSVTAAYGLLCVPGVTLLPAGSTRDVAVIVSVAALLVVAVRAPVGAVRWDLLRVAVGAVVTVHAANLLGLGNGGPLVIGAGTAVLVAVAAVDVHLRRTRVTEWVSLVRAGERRERDHEIRNILGGLSGVSHLLDGSRSGLTRAERDAVRRAFDAEVARLRSLVQADVVTPVESRDQRSGALDVVATVHEVSDLWQLNHAVRVRSDQSSVWAQCDESTLKQAVSNCLANCARHAPGARVEVTVRELGATVRIEVSDAGPGVPREVRFPTHPSSPAFLPMAADGHGVGLASTARLLARHGATLVLRPGRHGGSVVDIDLRAGQRPAALPEKERARAS